MPSHVCLGGGVPGAVEAVAVVRGLALGLVDEEEEEEDAGLAVLLGVVSVRSGLVLRSSWGLLLGFHFRVVLGHVPVGVRVRPVAVEVVLT